MLLNVDKSKMLHLDHGNRKVPYATNGIGLQVAWVPGLPRLTAIISTLGTQARLQAV
jgi:hypothetical protein